MCTQNNISKRGGLCLGGKKAFSLMEKAVKEGIGANFYDFIPLQMYILLMSSWFIATENKTKCCYQSKFDNAGLAYVCRLILQNKK